MIACLWLCVWLCVIVCLWLCLWSCGAVLCADIELAASAQDLVIAAEEAVDFAHTPRRPGVFVTVAHLSVASSLGAPRFAARAVLRRRSFLRSSFALVARATSLSGSWLADRRGILSVRVLAQKKQGPASKRARRVEVVFTDKWMVCMEREGQQTWLIRY